MRYVDEGERRQAIEDLRYYIKCKKDDIIQCYDNIEDINVEVREAREKIKDFMLLARNNGKAIVKLMEEREGLEEDFRDLLSMPDEDLGRDR